MWIQCNGYNSGSFPVSNTIHPFLLFSLCSVVLSNYQELVVIFCLNTAAHAFSVEKSEIHSSIHFLQENLERFNMPDLADFDPGNIDAAVSKKNSLSAMTADDNPEKTVAAKDSHDELKQSAKADVIISSLADSQGKSNPVPESGIEHADVQGALKLNNNKELCRYYKRGFCRYGDLCRFQHSDFTSINTGDVSMSVVTFLEKSEDESPKADDENDQNSPSYEPQAALLEALCINTDDEDEDEDVLEDDFDEDVPTCYCCYHP